MHRPPTIASWLLRIIVNKVKHYSYIGDMAEGYNDLAETKGKTIAGFWYRFQILKALPVFILHSFNRSITMLKNYLKIALRNLIKHKFYSLINISGLSIGIACFLLIALFVQYEFSYDNFHDKADRIFRVVEWQNYGGRNPQDVALTMGPLANAMTEDFPEVEMAVRLIRRNDVVNVGDKRFKENNLIVASEDFFKILSFKLLEGDVETVLKEPRTVVVSQELALKYFGEDKNIVGRTIKNQNFTDYKVTGLMENVPKNSHLQFDIVYSFATVTENRNFWDTGWYSNSLYTYIQLSESFDYRQLEEKFPAYINEKMPRQGGGNYWDILHISLQPFKDIHLKSSHLNYDLNDKKGNINTIYTFIAIAFFILLLACINYMNLSTARSANRAKEVGMRKVVGAERSNLIFQFLGDSLLMTLVSLIAGVLLLQIALPFFNQFIDRSVAFDLVNNSMAAIWIVGIFLFVGVVSGSYPAFFLSSFSPTHILKGKIKLGAKSSGLRKFLVTSQFAISVIIIIGTVAVFKQLDYMHNKQLGFNKEQILSMFINGERYRNLEAITNEIKQNPNIINVTAASSIPGQATHENGLVVNRPEGDQRMSISTLAIDFEYVETLGLEIVRGRGFSRDFPTDTSQSIIINETFAQVLDWEDPIGQTIDSGGEKKIIGIMRDYHYESLHQNIEPLAIVFAPGYRNFLSVKMRTENLQENIAYVKSVVEKFDQKNPFEYFFLDESFDSLYKSDRQVSTAFRYFSLLAIFIACLGLFGLASFTAEQRKKEIGIRKVLGAGSNTIIQLLSFDFLKLVIISNLIAWPIAYFAMNKWLQTFAYRIELNWTMFILSGTIALVIAFLTVGYQSLKSALSNPVNSLRYE